jgi:hypothetical protein
MCIHYLGHHLPSPHPATSRQNLFCPPVLWFCRGKNIKDNKKNTAFLLVWDKDSYAGKFLVLLPCTCVLQPTLVHLYQSSSLLPSPFPIAASASWTLLYLLLYSKHIKHIKFLVFFPFPIPPLHSLSLVWPMSNNITEFV